MDGMAWIGQLWLTTQGRLAACAVLFGLLVGLMPFTPGMYWWKSGEKRSSFQAPVRQAPRLRKRAEASEKRALRRAACPGSRRPRSSDRRVEV
jgi:hypothetical protein